MIKLKFIIYNFLIIVAATGMGFFYVGLIWSEWLWSKKTLGYVCSFIFSTLILFMLLGADHSARLYVICVVFSIELLFILIVARLEGATDGSNQIKFNFWIIFARYILLFIIHYLFIN